MQKLRAQRQNYYKIRNNSFFSIENMIVLYIYVCLCVFCL